MPGFFSFFRRRPKRRKKELSKLLHVGHTPRIRAKRQSSARTSMKVASLHAHKRISRFITPRFLLICMSITLAGICVGVIFFSSFFVVSDIVVIRDKVFVEPQKIEQSMRPVIGKNIFLVSDSQIQEELAKMFPTIQRVEVNKLYPRTIQVHVFSWPMIAQINYKDGSGTGFLLSENGYIVPNVLVREEQTNDSDKPRDLIKMLVPRYGTDDPEQAVLLQLAKLEPGKHFIDQQLLNKIRFSLDVYEKNFQAPVNHIVYLPFEREIHLYIGKTAILLWLDADVETQLYKLKTAEPKLNLTNDSLAYVDLRVKDKVFTCDMNAACAAKLK